MNQVVWTIAGSDSGGGAGIQADIKAMQSFGVHGCTAITALTAQNSLGVESLNPISTEVIESQLTHAYAQKIRRVYLGDLDYFDERKELLDWYEERGAIAKQKFMEDNGLVPEQNKKIASGDLF